MNPDLQFIKDNATLITLVLGAVGAAGAAFMWIYEKGPLAGRRVKRAEQLEKVYAPLHAAFELNLSTSTCTLIRYGYLSQRARRALNSAGQGRLREACSQVFDRGGSVSRVGIDGGAFPHGEIKRIAREQPHLVEPELLRLVGAYEREVIEQFDEGSPDELTNAEVAILRHVERMYVHLK